MNVFTIDGTNYDVSTPVLCPICVQEQRKCDLEVCTNHNVEVGMVLGYFSYQDEQVYIDYLNGAPKFKDHTRLNLTKDFWRCRDFTVSKMAEFIAGKIKTPDESIEFDALLNDFSENTIANSFKTDYVAAIQGGLVNLIYSGKLVVVINDQDEVCVALP